MKRWGLVVALLAFGCGHDSAGERQSGVILTLQTHAPGWQRAECFSCHLPKNLHLPNADTPPGMNLDQIQAVVSAQGEASCHPCHGNNGL
ncbi:MAG: hypothetical protein V1495_10190 [Pseudomonadota bacterium]